MNITSIWVNLLSVYWLSRNLVLESGEKSMIRLEPLSGTGENDSESDDAVSPFVSIIVPARNEEKNIKDCMETLLAQDYPAFELIVVDDESTDGTFAILKDMAMRDSRVKPVKAGPLPNGWLGKPHALHTGVTAAKGDLFWMVDADTRHDPKGLKTAVSFMDSRDIDLFSLIPRLEAGSFWEKTVQPLFYAWFDGRMMKRINDPLKSDVAACGPYFLVKRSCYEKVGGFEAQKDKLLEDLEFARAVKSAGCRFFLADGMKLYSLRMYSGISGLWKGWTKTFGGGLSGKRWLGVILALLLLFFSVSPFVFPIVVLSKMISGCFVSYKSVIMTFLPVMLLFMFRFRNDKFNMQDRRYIPTHPAGAIFLAAVMLKAGFSGSGVEWKGRKYTENGTIGGKYS